MTSGGRNPAGEGRGTESPSPAGRICDVIGCDGKHNAKGLCRPHYDRWANNRTIPARHTPDRVACPDDLVPLVTRLVENDARPIFTLLWRIIGNWHLQGLLEEQSA